MSALLEKSHNTRRIRAQFQPILAKNDQKSSLVGEEQPENAIFG